MSDEGYWGENKKTLSQRSDKLLANMPWSWIKLMHVHTFDIAEAAGVLRSALSVGKCRTVRGSTQ